MGPSTKVSRAGLLRAAAVIVTLAAIGWQTAPAARAAGAEYCEDYARQAVRQADLCRESKCKCPGKPWSQDFTIHYNWCRHAGGELIQRVLTMRRQQLWKCGSPSLPQRTEGRRGEWHERDRAPAAGALCPAGYPQRRGAHCYQPCRPGFASGSWEQKAVCFRCPRGFTRARLMPNGLLQCFK